MFILISIQGHTTICSTNFLLFPFTCYSAVQHTLYHVSVCTLLLQVLDMLIRCVPMSHQIVYNMHLNFTRFYLPCSDIFKLLSTYLVKIIQSLPSETHTPQPTGRYNELFRFDERRNLVPARVPLHFRRSLKLDNAQTI